MSGGGSGGGGSSGKVDWPEYFKNVHSDWLTHGTTGDEGALDQIELSMADVMNAAIGASPFAGVDAYDPDTDITNFEDAITAYGGLVTVLDSVTDWNTYHTAAKTAVNAYYMDDADIAAKTAIFASAVDGYVSGDETDFNAQQDADIPVAITAFDANRATDLVEAQAALATYTDAEILDLIASFNDQLDDEVETSALPRFKKGMQDINAVVSSSFVVGESWIESTATKKKAEFAAQLYLDNYKQKLGLEGQLQTENFTRKAAFEQVVRSQGLQQRSEHMMRQRLTSGSAKSGFDSNLRLQMYGKNYDYYMSTTEQMVKLGLQYVDFNRAVTAMIVEGKRLKVTMKKEETDQNLRIDEMHGKWDLEVFQYGANLLAAGHGGTANSNAQKSTPLQSALGGALSGAATLGMAGWAASGTTWGASLAASTGMGPIGWGVGLGALLGGAMGLFG